MHLKKEFPHNCTQKVKSEVKIEASADDHTVEVKKINLVNLVWHRSTSVATDADG